MVIPEIHFSSVYFWGVSSAFLIIDSLSNNIYKTLSNDEVFIYGICELFCGLFIILFEVLEKYYDSLGTNQIFVINGRKLSIKIIFYMCLYSVVMYFFIGKYTYLTSLSRLFSIIHISLSFIAGLFTFIVLCFRKNGDVDIVPTQIYPEIPVIDEEEDMMVKVATVNV